MVFWSEIDQIGEKLNNIGLVQFLHCLVHPVRPLEDHIAIKPRNILYIFWHGFDCNIEEALFLPDDGTPGNLHENVGVIAGQFEAAIKRKLHGYEWNREVRSKCSIV